METARKLLLSLPETEERSHFERPDFRVKNKIFASLHQDKNCVMAKLTPLHQSVFCAFDDTIIFPVPGGWGRQGCTFLNLKKIKKAMFIDAITTAWKTTAPKKMVQQYFGDEI